MSKSGGSRRNLLASLLKKSQTSGGSESLGDDGENFPEQNLLNAFDNRFCEPRGHDEARRASVSIVDGAESISFCLNTMYLLFRSRSEHTLMNRLLEANIYDVTKSPPCETQTAGAAGDETK